MTKYLCHEIKNRIVFITVSYDIYVHEQSEQYWEKKLTCYISTPLFNSFTWNLYNYIRWPIYENI